MPLFEIIYLLEVAMPQYGNMAQHSGESDLNFVNADLVTLACFQPFITWYRCLITCSFSIITHLLVVLGLVSVDSE